MCSSFSTKHHTLEGIVFTAVYYVAKAVGYPNKRVMPCEQKKSIIINKLFSLEQCACLNNYNDCSKFFRP